MFLNEVLCNFGFDGFVFINGVYVKVKEKCIYKEFINKDFINDIVGNFEKYNI